MSSCTQRSVGCGPDRFQSIKRLAAVQIHPPRNPNKPLTPFSIKDILNGRVTVGQGRGTGNNCAPSPVAKLPGVLPSPLKSIGIVRPWDSPGSRSSSPGDEEEIEVEEVKPPPASKNQSPLDALFKMTNKTFDGLDKSGAKPEDGSRRDQLNLFSKTQPPKKRRKSRTAFTNQQIYELEKRFLYQKYLTPADRDEIASSLGLTNAQVITWFQNRRAKLKRDLEELKADVTAAKSISSESGGEEGGSSALGMSLVDERINRDFNLRSPSPSPRADSTTPVQTVVHTDDIQGSDSSLSKSPSPPSLPPSPKKSDSRSGTPDNASSGPPSLEEEGDPSEHSAMDCQ